MSYHGDSPADELQVRRLVENWARAVRHRNLAEILANHSPQLLMFDVPGPLQLKGVDAYRDSWTGFFEWFGDTGIFELRELNVTAGVEVAFATALIHCVGVEPDHREHEVEVRLTMGLRKIGGLWTITHEHHSQPATV